MSERHPSPLSGVVLADCSVCPHRALLAVGQCVPGDVCVTAQSGRQIDRFLRRNPQFAQDYLQDGFWNAGLSPCAMRRWSWCVSCRETQTRWCAAWWRAVCRWMSWMTICTTLIARLRMTVAERIVPDKLGTLLGDEDYLVRLQAAKRLPHGQLRHMVDDEDREVRKEVARRLPPFALGLMMKDEDAEVRRIVAFRAMPDDAARMLADDDWVVRLEAVQRAPLEAIAEMVDDCRAGCARGGATAPERFFAGRPTMSIYTPDDATMSKLPQRSRRLRRARTTARCWRSQPHPPGMRLSLCLESWRLVSPGGVIRTDGKRFADSIEAWRKPISKPVPATWESWSSAMPTAICK